MPKPGFITASVFNSCMTKSIGKVVMKECCRIACERLDVRDLEEQFNISHVRAIKWGNEHENFALASYESTNLVRVHSRQQFHQIDGMMVGGTPDGLVGEDGGVEVKCPNSDNHLLNITQELQVDDYIHQVQCYLWITNREWWDFISFDPRFPKHLQMHVNRIERNDTLINAIEMRTNEMEKIISGMVDKARSRVCIDPIFRN